MSNSHEIAKNLVEKLIKTGWLIQDSLDENEVAEFTQEVQKVLAYELSEVPADFEAEPELQFP
jgi:hypothetical protein